LFLLFVSAIARTSGTASGVARGSERAMMLLWFTARDVQPTHRGASAIAAHRASKMRLADRCDAAAQKIFARIAEKSLQRFLKSVNYK